MLKDEDGQEMRLDDPAILLELLENEEDPEMKKYLKKQLKKSKKGKRKGPKKEKVDPGYSEFNEDAFMEDDGFGWTQKDAVKKLYQPKSLRPAAADGDEEMAEIHETEEENKLRLAREAGEDVAPSNAPVGDDDFGPTLPATGIAPRPEAGAIPGGSKLKPVLDDEVVEARLRQKALERAIQERLDKRLMRQKRIEVRLAGWIGKQRALKDEARTIAEERLLRAQEITEALAPEVEAQNKQTIKNRNQIVQEVREKLRREITDEVRREIEDEENRRQRASEKAPEAPKVPAAVMDAIQMSDAWEQFWRRYKSQLVDWKHWNEEMEEYHKQAAGWYFTQGFIQSQVSNNVPAAPDDKAENEPAEETMPLDPTEPPPPSSQLSKAPVLNNAENGEPPPPPTHAPEEEEDDDADNEDETGDEFQKKIRKKKTRYQQKMDRYEALLQDPIFDPENCKPKMQPWGAKDGEIRSMPGEVSSFALAPDGAKFVPKTTAMDAGEKAKLERMQKMLAVVRGPEALKKATYGTNYLPTQDDALQFIKLERFRRDRHRFRSSDLDSETESSEEDEAQTSRERGAKLPPWMAKSATAETVSTATTFSTRQTKVTTDVNQPGEMENPAGEALPMSSSSESEEDEERAAKIRAMAAKFNPTSIYGDTPVEKKVDEKEDEDESFSFGFLAGKKKEEKGEIAKGKQLYNREDRTPKYLPEESGLDGPGIHKEGPLKGLSKYWSQQHGLRQRPKESNKPQFVEVPVEHIPPSQR